MSEVTALHKESDGRGMFYVAGEKPGQDFRAAMMYHRWGEDDKTVNIDHTEVDDSLRGEGVGLQLMRALTHWAKGEGIGVSATCPFAVAMFEKHEEEFSEVHTAYTEKR